MAARKGDVDFVVFHGITHSGVCPCKGVGAVGDKDGGMRIGHIWKYFCVLNHSGSVTDLSEMMSWVMKAKTRTIRVCIINKVG